MDSIAPAPAHVEVTGYDGPVDRWQVSTFTPPGFVWLQVGSARAGAGGREAAPDDILLDRHTLHVVMPETADSTLYFWAMANSAASLSEEQEGLIYDRSLEAFNEDIVIIEGQQARRAPALATVDISADAGPLAVRRLMERLIAGQRPHSRTA